MVWILGSCGHGRAPDMYTESVFSETRFKARSCDSYEAFLEGSCATGETIEMGFNTPLKLANSHYYK
jgi:hypothetical protein